MKSKLAISLAALLLSAGAAAAADVSVAPSYWNSGFYLGLNAGAVIGNSDLDLHDWEGDDEGSHSENATGFIGGGQIGANWFINNFMIGIEGDYQYTSYDAQMNDTPYDDANIGQEVYGLGTARLRAGFLMNERALIYVTGGFAVTNETVKLQDESGHNNDTDDVTGTGWTLGGGLEYAIDEAWSVKGEYLYVATKSDAETYYAYEDETYKSDNEFHANIVRVGVNYRF